MNHAATFEAIPLEQLFPSPTNPRKTFDDLKLQELADSIAAHGVIEPLVVRPHTNGNGAKFEVVAGERRYRAASIARSELVPCMIRELSDVEVLEIQIIENNQRDDVHPLEEADGYAALMKSAGYDAAAIAGKIGRSEKYVYDRIKLLQLVPELKKAFVEGEITAGHAILLARLAPEGQRQVLGKDGDEEDGYEDGWYRGGLFRADGGEPDPLLELDDERDDYRKPVSVRELDAYIRDHVRFRPEAIDLPNLFPETAAALEEAEASDVKVVHITYEYRVADSARDENVRTYGQQAWKRADGQVHRGPYDSARHGKPSKTCEHSVMGIVVAGPGNGTAFRVCVAKKKCKVHWAAELKEAEKRAAERAAGKSSSSKPKAEKKPSWQIRQEKEDAERARWKPAMRDVAEAAVEAIKTADVLKLFDLIDAELGPWGRKKPRTSGTLEERVRALVGLMTGEKLDRQYPSPDRITEWCKTLGVDAKKIVDRVSPKPKPEKKPKASAAPKKKGARARRREKKAKAS